MESGAEFAEFEVNPKPFLYNELRLATQEFNDSTKLGQGSFGTVYKVRIMLGSDDLLYRRSHMLTRIYLLCKCQ